MHDGQIQSKTTKFVFPKGKKNTYLISRTFGETVQSLEDYADTPFTRILKSISFDTIGEIKIYT